MIVFSTANVNLLWRSLRMNQGRVFRPVSRLAVNILYLHIVVKKSLTPKGWMRQVVQADSSHTTCGVEAGDGQTLKQSLAKLDQEPMFLVRLPLSLRESIRFGSRLGPSFGNRPQRRSLRRGRRNENRTQFYDIWQRRI